MLGVQGRRKNTKKIGADVNAEEKKGMLLRCRKGQVENCRMGEVSTSRRAKGRRLA